MENEIYDVPIAMANFGLETWVDIILFNFANCSNQIGLVQFLWKLLHCMMIIIRKHSEAIECVCVQAYFLRFFFKWTSHRLMLRNNTYFIRVLVTFLLNAAIMCVCMCVYLMFGIPTSNKTQNLAYFYFILLFSVVLMFYSFLYALIAVLSFVAWRESLILVSFILTIILDFIFFAVTPRSLTPIKQKN